MSVDPGVKKLVVSIHEALAEYFNENPNMATLNQAMVMVSSMWPDIKLDWKDFVVETKFEP